ncbi:MAG: YicC family protein [Clostridia bacterium]|nr:YicC family protein [Clostridia bacterium]
MIKSMTGYGRAAQTIAGMAITVEIKSVNHRYFEFSSRTPRAYGFLDEKFKSFIQSGVSRGKIDCYVQIEALEEADVQVRLNVSLAQGYLRAFEELSTRFGIDNDVRASTLSRFGDIFTIHKTEADEEKVWEAVRTVAEDALGRFIAMRVREGERLRADVLSRADAILENVAYIESRSPQTVREYNEKLRARMQTVLDSTQVDEQRILLEAAIYADKVAVAEETVRLRSHIDQLRVFFESEEAVGRKLDFLVQEINREANTIGSKAQDVEIARRVIDIKAEVEKIREQIQNIE